MTCPRCKLQNPDSAERCDCGYDFIAKAVKSSYAEVAAVEKYGPPPEPSEAVRADGRDDIIVGVGTFAIGLGLSLGTYFAGMGRTGGYVLFHGAMIWGLLRVRRGLHRKRTGLDLL